MEFLRNLSERHERLKKRIHSTRIPLSRNGQLAMTAVYFTIPIVCGYYIMKWTERRAEANFHNEEAKIRNAGGMSARFVKQQNAQLKQILEDTTSST